MPALNDHPTKRCLLIAPLTFYSFYRVVAEGLKDRGYEVEVLNEEFPANSIGKIFGKISLPILRKFTLSGLKKRLGSKEKFDLILIIKGRGLGDESIEYLKSMGSKIVGYNFDSFAYNPSPLDWMKNIDLYTTFDFRDAGEYNLPLVHLFTSWRDLSPVEKTIDLSIIQRVHSDRLSVAERLIRSIDRNTKLFVFFYESSRLLFIASALRSPILYYRMWRYISFKSLSYSDAMGILAKSRVTFDYGHPDQTGITVRCFEASALGTSILTNNQFAVESGLFDERGIDLVRTEDSASEISDKFERLKSNRPNPTVRTLAQFLDDLIGLD